MATNLTSHLVHPALTHFRWAKNAVNAGPMTPPLCKYGERGQRQVLASTRERERTGTCESLNTATIAKTSSSQTMRAPSRLWLFHEWASWGMTVAWTWFEPPVRVSADLNTGPALASLLMGQSAQAVFSSSSPRGRRMRTCRYRWAFDPWSSG